MRITFVLLFVLQLKGCCGYNNDVSSNPTSKGLIGKEMVHTLNDTDVHRLCQGPLGCGSLKTNFTSTYNATARKINHVPANHPILDHAFIPLNPLDLFGNQTYIERNNDVNDNESSIIEIDPFYYWDDEEDVSSQEIVYIGIGCSAAVILILVAGIGYLCLKHFQLRTIAATQRLQVEEQRQMDIELLEFVTVDLDC